jgi:N-carbamoylputrescine amidase
MTLIRITIVEFPDDPESIDEAFADLRIYLHSEQTDLLVLPELFGFSSFWQRDSFDADLWLAASAAHERYLERLAELNAKRIIGTIPTGPPGGPRHNTVFWWSSATGVQQARSKYHLPDEEGGYELTWFERGNEEVALLDIGSLVIAPLVCTEVMVSPAPTLLGRSNVECIVAPRATGSHPRWEVALRMAAIQSGAFVASSNRRSSNTSLFGGTGMLISPDGDVLAATTAAEPVLTTMIETDDAARAKTTYPRTVRL